MRGNGEECDESKRGMSAQRLVEMLLASLHGSNVQLLLCLRPPLHAVISAQAPGYGPCNGPIVSCHGSQSTSESLGPSGGALHFTLNIHVVLLVIIGWRTLRQWTANITMNNPPTPPYSTLHTMSLCSGSSTSIFVSPEFYKKSVSGVCVGVISSDYDQQVVPDI